MLPDSALYEHSRNAQVYINGDLIGRLERSNPRNLSLSQAHHDLAACGTPASRSAPVTLDILVEAFGRVNFGCVWVSIVLEDAYVRLLACVDYSLSGHFEERGVKSLAVLTGGRNSFACDVNCDSSANHIGPLSLCSPCAMVRNISGSLVAKMSAQGQGENPRASTLL